MCVYRARFFFYLDIRSRHASWHRVTSHRMREDEARNTSPPVVSISFVNQESLRIFLWGGGVDIGSQEGRRHRRLSFILSDSLSKSEFLPSGYTLELKEQPSRLSSLFSSFFQASPLPRPFNPVLEKA